MPTKQYIKQLNGYYIKDEEAREAIEAAKIPQRPYFFANVANMKLADLPIGSRVLTNGFYAANDGGGADYVISELAEEETADDKFVISIANNKVARLIINGRIDIRTIGAAPENDIHDYVLAIVDKGYECYIPSGVWKTSPLQIATYTSAIVRGEKIYGNNNTNGTIITPIQNQDYILKVGFDNATSIANDITIENIQFNCGEYQVINAVLFHRVQFSKFDELCFRNCKCTDCAFRIRETWETDFGRVLFRIIDADYALIFGDKIGAGNISTNYFKFISFEGCRGNCIKFEPDCAYSMNTIDVLDFESGTATFGNETRKAITSVDSYTPLAIIETGNGNAEININNIHLNNIAHHVYVDETAGTARAFDRVIEGKATDTGYFNFAIGCVTGVGNTNKPILINATKIDKFVCNAFNFRAYLDFTVNIEGCRAYKFVASDFVDKYVNANLERAYRDLTITNNVASCAGKDHAVRIASLKKTGDTLYFHAKGTGQVWYGSTHVSATDASAFAWYSIDISELEDGSYNNLQITTNANVEVDDYYIA